MVLNLPNMSRQEARELLESLRESYRGIPRKHQAAVKQELSLLATAHRITGIQTDDCCI